MCWRPIGVLGTLKIALTFDGLMEGGGGGAVMEVEEVAGFGVSVNVRRL